MLAEKATLGLSDRSVASSPDVILATATFASEQDPWTTDEGKSSMHLNMTLQSGKWTVIERVLKEKLRPLFTKAKNPAITSEGRKNFQPVPPTRFDGSVLDDSTKPWKNTDIYATSVLSWIISQYEVCSNNRTSALADTLTSISAHRQGAPRSALPSHRTRNPVSHR